MLWIICEREHEHFTQKIDNHIIVHDHETRSGIINQPVLPCYPKSTRQNAAVNRNQTIVR